MHIWMIKYMIKSKDEEIERLVQSRNKLEDKILSALDLDRLSSRKEDNKV